MVIRATGGTEVFEETEMPRAALGYGQVRLRVKASSVNPIDAKIRSGAVPALVPDLPAILHGDVCGEVIERGPGVADLAVGQRVFGQVGGVKGLPGVLAEEVVAEAALLAPVPEPMDDLTAAALPVVGMTAWMAVVERGGVRPGETVLITGGAGGVGHLAVQLAVLAGAQVFATVSTEEKAALVRGWGATPLLYPDKEPAALLADAGLSDGFDAVIDTVGGSALGQAMHLARAGGRVVTIAARGSHELTAAHPRELNLSIVFLLRHLQEPNLRVGVCPRLEKLAQSVAQERLHVLHAQTFPWKEVAAAHQMLETAHFAGKITLQW